MPARQPAEITFCPHHFHRGCERTLFASSCRIIGAVCSSDAAPRRIGRNHSRRFCHLMMARLAGGRRPERYQGVTTVKKKGIRIGDPRCQLVIVNARPSDLRCQKHQLTSITHAVDGPSNRVLYRSIPYYLGPGRLSRLKKSSILTLSAAELIRLGKTFVEAGGHGGFNGTTLITLDGIERHGRAGVAVHVFLLDRDCAPAVRARRRFPSRKHRHRRQLHGKPL